MAVTANESNRQWQHVHCCPQCGYVVKAEDLSHTAVSTGVMICPKCDCSGPINIQIVPMEFLDQ